MSTVLLDLRFALRTFVQRPGFTLVVVLTLGLGLGGAITVFDLMNALNWRRLPVEKPDEVIEVYTGSVHDRFGTWGLTSYPDYLSYRDMDVFAGLAAGYLLDADIDIEADPASSSGREEVSGWMVSGNYFAVLGVGAALGRVLEPRDDPTGAAPAVVLTWAYWQRSFAGDPRVLGRTVRIQGRPATIVGVAREGFGGTIPGSAGNLAFWMAVGQAPRWLDTEVDWLGDPRLKTFDVMGRLRPGTSIGAAQAALRSRAERLDLEHPIPDLERHVTVVNARVFFPGDWDDFFGTPTRIMAAAMALLLLIACANVANLLLARAAIRRREMGLRLALGANRFRLLRQLLTESLLLALAGGLWGLCLAWWARGLLATVMWEWAVGELRFDGRVLALSLAACVGATLLFGLAPAFLSARVDLVSALKSGGASSARHRLPLGQLMVGAQVALSAILLVAAGLLGRSLLNLQAVDPGFDVDRLVYAWTEPDPKRYSHEEGRAFYRRLTARAESLPGVRRAGLAMTEALTRQKASASLRRPERPEEVLTRPLNIVDGAYFETLGIPLRRGRLFHSGDDASSRPVAILSQALADELWPGEDPLGRTIRVEGRAAWDPGPDYEVVGVVGSTRQHDPSGEPDPIIYFSCYQRYRSSLAVVLRTAGEAGVALEGLRAELAGLDPALRLSRVRTGEEMRRLYMIAERSQIQVVAIFGILGWFLAVVGVASVMSYAVNREVRAIGIRMAVGARRRDVVGWILGRGLKLALAGLGAGLTGALAAAVLLRHMLFGVGVLDPVVFAAVALVLVASALGAAWWPARRAARVDPLLALRHD